MKTPFYNTHAWTPKVENGEEANLFNQIIEIRLTF